MILHLPLKIKILPVLALLFLSVNAQKIVPTHEDIYAEAEEYIFAGEYNEALPLYLSLYEKGFTTANLSYKIGECYLNIPGHKDKSIPYLEKAVSKVSSSFSGKDLTEENAPLAVYLYLGVAYRLVYDFDKARQTFKSMLRQVDTADHQTRMLLEYHINRCYNAEALIQSPTMVHWDLLPQNINNLYSNTNALPLPNEKTVFYVNQLKFYNAVMQSVKTDEGWQEPVNMTPLIKSDGDHIITGTSVDGKTILLTAYDPYNSGEIYSSEFMDGKWTPIAKLNGNINTIFNETHASLSADGKTLFFTSDRKGGFGGLDIYKSELKPDGWGPPVNLGPAINTIFDEETPFLTSDGKKLFFSSQGHYNMGGFDIFYSEKNFDNWLSPANIGFPINTPDDDRFCFPLDTGSVAYMSVMDKDTRQLDIGRFVVTKYTNPARYTLSGNVDIESGQKAGLNDIQVTFVEKNNQDTIATQILDKEGKFSQKLPQGSFQLAFTNSDGNLIDSREFNIPANFPQDQLVFNTRILVDESSPTVAEESIPTDTFCLEDILFAFDKSYIPTQSTAFLNTLVELMTRYPEILLQINGFADALGEEDYNLKLSYSRAMAVADFIKNRHINPSRFVSKGLGEAMPVAINCNADGTDNPEGRKFNRRVEIRFTMLPVNCVILKKDTIPAHLKSK
jgi:outer membrane protein OmpA-like peptidoglycan-associated protein/tetratricopeptide (TPR) repeat protein